MGKKSLVGDLSRLKQVPVVLDFGADRCLSLLRYGRGKSYSHAICLQERRRKGLFPCVKSDGWNE